MARLAGGVAGGHRRRCDGRGLAVGNGQAGVGFAAQPAVGRDRHVLAQLARLGHFERDGELSRLAGRDVVLQIALDGAGGDRVLEPRIESVVDDDVSQRGVALIRNVDRVGHLAADFGILRPEDRNVQLAGRGHGADAVAARQSATAGESGAVVEACRAGRRGN